MHISLPFPILSYIMPSSIPTGFYWDNRNLEFQILMQIYGKQYVVVYLFKMLKILHVVGPMVIWSI